MERKAIIAQPGEGVMLHAFGEQINVMINGRQSGNTITVMLDTTPPNGGPPPHHHENEDELFLVLEGRVNYFADGVWTEVRPGGAVFMPRGVVHCYKNIGETLSRQWTLTTPSGFETFFSRCADEFAQPNGPDMQHIIEISGDHGIFYQEVAMEKQSLVQK